MNSILADLILILHAGIVAFNVFSLPLIIIGGLLRQEFVHNPWFRYSHIASMGVVLLLVIFNVICPLTNWEDKLRSIANTYPVAKKTIIQRWLGQIIYYDFSWSTFVLLYGFWFIAILLTLWLIPVRRRH